MSREARFLACWVYVLPTVKQRGRQESITCIAAAAVAALAAAAAAPPPRSRRTGPCAVSHCAAASSASSSAARACRHDHIAKWLGIS